MQARTHTTFMPCGTEACPHHGLAPGVHGQQALQTGASAQWRRRWWRRHCHPHAAPHWPAAPGQGRSAPSARLRAPHPTPPSACVLPPSAEAQQEAQGDFINVQCLIKSRDKGNMPTERKMRTTSHPAAVSTLLLRSKRSLLNCHKMSILHVHNMWACRSRFTC